MMGAPRVMVCDQGREFISEHFSDWAEAAGISLYRIGVQAPWQNGIAERTGGTLKAITHALVKAIGEAVAAYNSDINEEGVTPLQCVTGRQPRDTVDSLTSLDKSLAAHSLLEFRPSLARQLALRETARVAVAMVRLHYSRGLRQASLARSRAESPEDQLPQPGDIVFFFRQQRASRRKGGANAATSAQRRKLELRRWHGPGLIATELGADGAPGRNCFISFRGQITKCAREHVRKGSSLEQLAAGAWQDEILLRNPLLWTAICRSLRTMNKFLWTRWGLPILSNRPSAVLRLWQRSAHQLLRQHLRGEPHLKVCLVATHDLNNKHFLELLAERLVPLWVACWQECLVSHLVASRGFNIHFRERAPWMMIFKSHVDSSVQHRNHWRGPCGAGRLRWPVHRQNLLNYLLPQGHPLQVNSLQP